MPVCAGRRRAAAEPGPGGRDIAPAAMRPARTSPGAPSRDDGLCKNSRTVTTGQRHPRRRSGTVRGPRRPLRGQSPELARQEAWALLLIHNITATASARAAGSAGLDPGLIPFTAVSASSGPTSPRTPAAGTAGTAPPAPAPAGQPERRDPRPAPPPARTPADIRQNSHRTTNPAHRRSHLHHRHHKIESPKMGHNSGNLRAVGVPLCRVLPSRVRNDGLSARRCTSRSWAARSARVLTALKSRSSV